MTAAIHFAGLHMWMLPVSVYAGAAHLRRYCTPVWRGVIVGPAEQEAVILHWATEEWGEMASPGNRLSRPGNPSEPHPRWQAILFRCLACGCVALALALSFPDPGERPRLPDPWAYRFAAENFAQGRWVITGDQAAAGRMAARLQGGHLTQYVNVGPDRWALEKAPGFPLLVAPLQQSGIPQFTNAALAIVAAISLYIVVALWYGEGLACAAVALFLLTPMSLSAQHDAWMDTFAGGAVALVGGAFYFLAWFKIGKSTFTIE